MAPLPVSNTPRYKAFYTVGAYQHTQEWRTSQSPSAFSVDLDAFWSAIEPNLYECTIDDVQFAASGSNVFNSVSMPFVGSTYGSGTPSTGETPYFLSAVGRSTDGRRLRQYWFGAKALGGDYRYQYGENTACDNLIDALVAAGSDLKTIGGLTPIWKQYINAGVNAYWQRQVRP
ncbi:MAG: hypothetical protein [Circular genetic element sp.]|nr:MAG: hypothetical protein [Circular genetic element sp.]